MRLTNSLLAMTILALIICSITTATRSLAQANACIVDAEMVRLRFPRCALRMQNGHQFVPAKYIKQLDWNRYDLAWLGIEDDGWVYVNRAGKIVLRHIATMDNGADDFHHGIVRVLIAGKYGFIDSRGRVVVPAEYDSATNTEDTPPVVNRGCESQTKGEYTFCVGGKSFQVHRDGKLTPTKPR